MARIMLLIERGAFGSNASDVGVNLTLGELR